MLVRGIDYYELLGVARNASPGEIRSAYRALAKAMHPDAGGTAGAFRLLREAYETLSDPTRRADYDDGDPLDDWYDAPRRRTRNGGTSRRYRDGQYREPADYWNADPDDDTGDHPDADPSDEAGSPYSDGESDNDDAYPDGESGDYSNGASHNNTGTYSPGGSRRGNYSDRHPYRYPAGEGPAARGRRGRRMPSHVPALPVLQPATIPWWEEVRRERRVALTPTTGPSQAVALGTAGGGAALVLLLALVGSPVWLVILVLFAGLAATVEVGRRHLAAQRVDREFAGEFGDRVVFGAPGQEDDELGERLTAELLKLYLTRIPGVRICHGLAAEEGSVFADLDHAVLCGRRLVLVESKLWLPGHYEADDDGEISRNGHRFRGGTIRLPERLAAYRALLPDVEVRGVLLIYPSRAGKITVGDGVAHTPERFVREIGAWLASEPSIVDREVFRTLLQQVTNPR